MEQHPVPQPITSYEFRLIGDMTIKQFAKLAAGIIAALLVYAIFPSGAIKWFFIFIFALIGIAMAFVPFEGRPIDTWIIAFFKRIYSPTQYVWRPGKQAEGDKTTVQNQVQPNLVEKTVAPVMQQQPLPPQPPAPYISATPFKTGPDEIDEMIKNIIPKPEVVLKQFSKPLPVDATFSPETVIPAAPTYPNIIVGYIRSKEGKIIDGAILEIRDSSGNPVRALKSNRLGQFQIATPLPSGLYEIETDKEGFSFDTIRIELNGNIMPPVEIVSK